MLCGKLKFIRTLKAQALYMKLPKKDAEKVIEVEGTVVAALPKLEYTVDIDYKGLKHTVTCHVSGKMRTRYIELEKGDKVLVRISLYDIDRGIIFKRLSRNRVNLPIAA